jgi:hypothetical protein
MAGMDSTYLLSGGCDSRGPRSRSKNNYYSKTTNDIDQNLGTQLGTRATDGTAAVGARTMAPMTIVHMVHPTWHQAFLRDFQTMADGGEGNAEGAVAQTADGLVYLRTKGQWVAYKLTSMDDTTTDRYKTYKQLEEQINALNEAANSDISLLELTYETARCERQQRAAIADRDAVGARHRMDGAQNAPGEPDDDPEAPADPGGDEQEAPVDNSRKTRARTVARAAADEGEDGAEDNSRRAADDPSGEPRPDFFEGGGGGGDGDEGDGDDADRDGEEDRWGEGNARAAPPTARNVAQLMIAMERSHERTLAARVSGIEAKLKAKVEEVRGKHRHGLHATYLEVLEHTYDKTATLGWARFLKAFELSAVQALLSILGASKDGVSQTPPALFALVMTDWASRCSRIDLKHAAGAYLKELLLTDFAGKSFGIDGMLSLMQHLRASASAVVFNPTAKELVLVWGMLGKNDETRNVLERMGTKDVNTLTQHDTSSLLLELRMMEPSKVQFSLDNITKDIAPRKPLAPRFSPREQGQRPPSHGVTFGSLGSARPRRQSQAMAAQPAPGGRDMSSVDCYNCGQRGHYSRNCPESGDGESPKPPQRMPREHSRGPGERGKSPGRSRTLMVPDHERGRRKATGNMARASRSPACADNLPPLARSSSQESAEQHAIDLECELSAELAREQIDAGVNIAHAVYVADGSGSTLPAPSREVEAEPGYFIEEPVPEDPG